MVHDDAEGAFVHERDAEEAMAELLDVIRADASLDWREIRREGRMTEVLRNIIEEAKAALAKAAPTASRESR